LKNNSERLSPELKRHLAEPEGEEAKINRNLLQIEKRLGLFKPDKFNLLQQMVNPKQT
jgi:hypothetical protein